MKRHYILSLLCLCLWHTIQTLDVHSQNMKKISGVVYLDYNGNAQMDHLDKGHPAIRVNVYDDINSNGYKDDNDTLWAVVTSDVKGRFELEFSPKVDTAKQYIASLESEDLPTDAKLTAATKLLTVKENEELKLGFQGISVLCYAIGDGDRSNPSDELIMLNRISGHQYPIKGRLKTLYIEAMAISPGGKSLYAVNKDKLGRVDFETGYFMPLPDTMGVGRGSLGIHSFKDIDALAFDPFSGKLYAAERRSGGRDLLCLLDTLTGKIIPNAFGEGIDYVLMEGDEGVQAEIDGLAISPVDGKMYGINNFSNVTHYDFLVEIDKTTGKTTIIDTLKVDEKYLHDAEGLGFTNDGQLRLTTGGNTVEEYMDAVFTVDINNAKATHFARFSASSDYESCDCLTGEMNKIAGKVFEDLNQSDSQDKDEVGLKDMTVYIYKDNGDGQIGVGDILLDSTYTNEKGLFEWIGAANVDLIMELKAADLPVGYEYTSKSSQLAYFGGSIGADEDLDNEFAVAHGSYLSEWIAFTEVRRQTNALWASTNLERDMMASKSATNSIDLHIPAGIKFGSVGTVVNAIAFAGASENMVDQATQPAIVKKMSMKDPFLTGIRFKPVESDGTVMTANPKEFLEGQLPSWIAPAMACKLMRAAKFGSEEIIWESNDLKPGTYMFQVFNRTDVCMKKITIEHKLSEGE